MLSLEQQFTSYYGEVMHSISRKWGKAMKWNILGGHISAKTSEEHSHNFLVSTIVC